MENFINGFPGVEHTLRQIFIQELGILKAKFFFDRMLDHFITEQDIAFVKNLGINSIRIPFNYRHLENDQKPYFYRDEGFHRLKQVLGWCEKYSLYAILDLHAAQGYQNSDWHCDNNTGTASLWDHPHFQNRLVALWNTLAREFKNNTAVAGYEILNEPSTGQFGGNLRWDLLNKLNKRVVLEIRKIDPNHIIFLEGDHFTNKYSKLEEPFTQNLVYSTHNYHPPGFGPGPYPGKIRGEYWNKLKQKNKFEGEEGTKFAKKYNVPLWAGEFGSVYNGPQSETGYRLKALDDQIDLLEKLGIHWTLWTYKDTGTMGWVTPDPKSDYMQLIQPLLNVKKEFGADPWMHWMPMTVAKHKLKEYGLLLEKELKGDAEVWTLLNNTLSNATGTILQKEYVLLFKGMSEEKIDDILKSFRLENCIVNQGLVDIVKKHCQPMEYANTV